MVYCPNCGSANSENSRYCNNCGSELVFDGSSKPQSSYQPPQQQMHPSYQNNQNRGPRPRPYQRPADQADGWIYLCAFCIPIVGIILWIVWREERPSTASNLLIISIISFVLNFFGGLLFSF